MDWKIFFVSFTKLIPRKNFLCIAKILVLMVNFFCRPSSPGLSQGQTRFVPRTNWVCHRDKLSFHYVKSGENLGFSLGQSGFVQRTNLVCPWDNPGVVPRATGPKSLCSDLFCADFGKEFPSRTLWKGPSWTCPIPSSVLCNLLYRIEHFSRGRKGQKGGERRGGRGVASQGGKKEKRTRENRSVFMCLFLPKIGGGGVKFVNFQGSIEILNFGAPSSTQKTDSLGNDFCCNKIIAITCDFRSNPKIAMFEEEREVQHQRWTSLREPLGGKLPLRGS